MTRPRSKKTEFERFKEWIAALVERIDAIIHHPKKEKTNA